MNEWTFEGQSRTCRQSIIKMDKIDDAHLEIRVHAPYSASHRSKFVVHERTSTIYLQLRYNTIRLEV